MIYNKPHQTPAQTVALLESKGLDISDKPALEAILANVSYYRLKAYFYPFRQADHTFVPGTTFDTVWRHYTFDRHLRLLTIDAIERVEVALRCRLMNVLASQGGPFAHLDPASFNPTMDPAIHPRFVDALKESTTRSRDAFVSHYQQKYESDPAHRFTADDGIVWHHLPIWMACELMTFGNVLTMYRNLKKEDKNKIARPWGIEGGVLETWLVTLNFVRNVCAHHSRLWNRAIPVKPVLPKKKKHPNWHTPHPVPVDRVFGVLTILRYLLPHVAPQTQWGLRLADLLDNYPEIDRAPMGFYPGWETSPIWSGGQTP